jgi:hypothetical protein
MMVKEICERECARELEPEIQNFRCEECRRARQENMIDVVTKVCPKCATPIEKDGGCNHITCICGSHWCWHCGKDEDELHGTFDRFTVYDHMNNCGGVFPNEDAEEEYIACVHN